MNKEERKAYNKAYVAAHREEINAYQRAYRKAHYVARKPAVAKTREEVSERNRQYYQAHRDERIAYARAYREANRERNRERDRAQERERWKRNPRITIAGQQRVYLQSLPPDLRQLAHLLREARNTRKEARQ